MRTRLFLVLLLMTSLTLPGCRRFTYAQRDFFNVTGSTNLNAGQNDRISPDVASLEYSVLAAPRNGTATVVDAATGIINYTPNTGFTGEDVFTYILAATYEDPNDPTHTQTVRSSALVRVRVQGTTGTETPVADTATATSTGGAVTIDVLDNDPSGSTLLGIVDPTTSGTVNSATLASGATVAVSGTEITYNPNGFTGPSDTFQYRTNGGTATVTVTVSTPANPPVDDTAFTIDADTATDIDVLANDPTGSTLAGIVDPTTSATVSSATLASGATVTVSGSQISYDPNGTTATTDTFDYRTADGDAMVTVTIGAAIGQVVLDNATAFASTWTLTAPGDAEFLDPTTGSVIGTTVTVAPSTSDIYHAVLGPTGTASAGIGFSVTDSRSLPAATGTFSVSAGTASGDTQTDVTYSELTPGSPTLSSDTSTIP